MRGNQIDANDIDSKANVWVFYAAGGFWFGNSIRHFSLGDSIAWAILQMILALVCFSGGLYFHVESASRAFRMGLESASKLRSINGGKDAPN